MNFDSNKHLIDSAKQYKVAAPEAAWSQLETKLTNRNNAGKVRWYRNVSIAATLVAIISVLSVFNYNTSSEHDAYGLFVISKIELEDMTQSDGDNIYNLEKIASLRLAYEKLGTKRSM